MNNASQNLEYILTIDELSRENDKRLISEYLKEFHCKSNTEKAIIERIINEAPNLWYLIRQRADLQNKKGLYQPSDRVIEIRKQKEEKIRTEYSWFWSAVARYFNK